MKLGDSFEESFNKTRAEVVFTTHTPIVEGNESHSVDKLEYMGAFNGLTKNQMIGIGGDPFNMTIAGLRLSRKANAVAGLHMETANKMWKTVDGRAKIIGITNGIHKPTWVDARITKAFENNGDLWDTHITVKKELIAFIKERTGTSLAADKLLIGFSRRAAPYKRSDLIFTI